MTRHELWMAKPQDLIRFAFWLGVDLNHAITKEWLVDRVLLRLASRP